MRRIITLFITLFLVLAGSRAAWGFEDTGRHWAGSSIEHLEARGVVSGRTPRLFYPDASITRAEFAALLTRTLGYSEECQSLQAGKSVFKDVDNRYWAKGALLLCQELGIIYPDSQGRCYPDRVLTRAEAAGMVQRALNIEGKKTYAFKDENVIPSWALGAVSAVAASGLMEGWPGGSFRPNDPMTRAQAALLMENVLAFMGDKYHGQGTLTALDTSAGTARIIINGESCSFSLADNFKLKLIDGASAPSLPLYCNFDIGADGSLVYCQEIPALPANQVSITSTSRKVPAVSEAPMERPLVMGLESISSAPGGDVRASSALNLVEIGANELKENLGVNGQGVRIAVLDTGIDPGHPDLLQASGQPVVVEWLDVTNAGRIGLEIAPITGDAVQMQENTILLGGYASISKSRKAAWGYLKPSRLPCKLKNVDSEGILVVALDAQKTGVYDTVLIDTDCDGAVNDEKPLHRYGLDHSYVSLKTDRGLEFNLVVSQLDPYGTWVKLGFDGNGHGTKVAGVLAGSGKMQGVAPGAQIIAVKVSDGYGGDDYQYMLEGIKALGSLRVEVANISLGYTSLSTARKQELEELIAYMSERYGITFCIAAGNLGPGLGTVTVPATANGVIAVGGYLSPDMWLLNYGWHIKQTTLWAFSSSGPTGSGMSPLLTAPAAGTTTTACWDGDYSFEEGTSIAAPYAAGGVALLIEAARKNGIRTTPDTLRAALAAGCKAMPGFTACEVGYGRLNLPSAWVKLKENPGRQVESYQEGKRTYYMREFAPAVSYLRVVNPGGSEQKLNLSTSAGWVKLPVRSITVPAYGTRVLRVEYDEQSKPGLYSAIISGDNPAAPGVELQSLQAVVVPAQLKPDGSKFSASGEIPAGMYRRYYLQVPEGQGTLRVKLQVPKDASGKYQGRLRLHIMAPDGSLVTRTYYAGAGYPTDTPLEYIDFTEANPTPGVWEVVVYSSVTIEQYFLDKSRYTLEARLENWTSAEENSDQRYIVTYWLPPDGGIKPQSLTLHFWDRASRRPVWGNVVINGRLYEIKDGQVQVHFDRSWGDINKINIIWLK